MIDHDNAQPIPSIKSHKEFWWILSLAIVAVASMVGTYWWTSSKNKNEVVIVNKAVPTVFKMTEPSVVPTTDPTAEWKTYRNEKYGFSFQYPSNFSYKEKAYTKNNNGIFAYTLVELADAKAFIPEPIGQPAIMFYVSETTDQSLLKLDESYGVLKTIIVGGAEATVYGLRGCQQSCDQIVRFTRGSLTYEFSEQYTSKDSNLETTLNQILGTFKLTNQQISKTEAGSITGKLCYPSDHVPSGKVTAKNRETSETFSINYEWDGNTRDNPTYSMSLKPGNYHVRFEVGSLVEYYTDVANCYFTSGGCSQTQPQPLLTAVVKAGQTVANVNLCDMNTSLNPPEF